MNTLFNAVVRRIADSRTTYYHFMSEHGIRACKEVVKYRARIKGSKLFKDKLFWDKFAASAEARAIHCANCLMRG